MTAPAPQTALVLAGHGSHISPHTAGLVWEYVDRLRQQGVADEITAAFWKEDPSFSHILHTLAAPTVVVVPLFTAEGYFSQRVIPAEMDLDGPLTRRGERVIHYTRTLGVHAGLAAVVRQRVADVMAAHQLSTHQTAVAVIGHGTPRSRRSQDTTRQQADGLRAAGLAAEVVAAFLDDDPDIPSIYQRTSAPNLIAMPYFLAPGSHVTGDVPAALGLMGDASPAHIQGRRVFYTDPVGTAQTVCQLVLSLARQTGLPLPDRPASSPWRHFPAAGWAALLAALRERGELSLGQLRIRPHDVRHQDDDPTSTDLAALTSPAALRQRVRDNPFRPLPTAADLPGGWYVPVPRPADLPAIVETVYPGLLADWAAWQAGTFQAETLAAVAARQQGMFREVNRLPAAHIDRVVAAVCTGCIRQPTWHAAPTGTDASFVPCRSPCNVLLSALKKQSSTAEDKPEN